MGSPRNLDQCEEGLRKMIIEEIKRRTLRALSGAFSLGEKTLDDWTAQIVSNERETIYHYGGEKFREPTEQANEANELAAVILSQRP